MTARQLIEDLVKSVGDLDDEVFARIVYREPEGNTVISSFVAPIARIGSTFLNTLVIEASEIKPEDR